MTAVLESHSVARIGVDLNHFVLKILNIDNFSGVNRNLLISERNHTFFIWMFQGVKNFINS